MTAAFGPAGRPFAVRRFGEVGSTNDLAREAAEAGLPDRVWFVAERQARGRGRQGRGWASPAGNFHGSLHLETRRDLAQAPTLSLVAGLAVAEAVHALADGRLVPRLKWPNDVLLGGAKLAGILLEGGRRPGGPGGWVVMGVGVNLAHHPLDLPYPATSLAAAGLPGVGPDGFLDALAGPLARRLNVWEAEGFAPFREPWLDAAAGVGAPVRLRLGHGTRSGRFADLGPDGALVLERQDGRLERFAAGELFLGPDTAHIAARAVP